MTMTFVMKAVAGIKKCRPRPSTAGEPHVPGTLDVKQLNVTEEPLPQSCGRCQLRRRSW